MDEPSNCRAVHHLGEAGIPSMGARVLALPMAAQVYSKLRRRLVAKLLQLHLHYCLDECSALHVPNLYLGNPQSQCLVTT